MATKNIVSRDYIDLRFRLVFNGYFDLWPGAV